jgi:hypothetical protein
MQDRIKGFDDALRTAIHDEERRPVYGTATVSGSCPRTVAVA